MFTNPKPWDGKLAYARFVESVPVIGWHFVFTHGLVPWLRRQPPLPQLVATAGQGRGFGGVAR